MGNLDIVTHAADTASQEQRSMMTAVVEMGADGHYRVRLRSGQLVRAQLDGDVCPEFVGACIQERRRMIVEREEGELYIVGALQTELRRLPEGHAERPVRIDLSAKEELTLRAGNSTLTLREDGKVTLRGSHLTMDVARLVKLLAAKVELP